MQPTDQTPAPPPLAWADTADPAANMARMSEILMTQANALDEIFSDMAGQAKRNLIEWPGIARAYAHLAIRAQANCRASLEAMARVDRATRSGRDDPAD